MSFIVLLGLAVFVAIVIAVWPKPRPIPARSRRASAQLSSGLRDVRREVEQIERGIRDLRADWSVLVAQHALEAEAEKPTEAKPRATRKHWIQTFNEAECFRYVSLAGNPHYFRPLGKVYRNEVYYIKVQRIRTGEVLDIMTTALEPCTLAEGGDDPATDDARTRNNRTAWA